jgi:predicted CoA-binding protein
MTTDVPLDDIRRIYAETKVIAVVGASPDDTKTANVVPSYLQEVGYRIVPVNPNHEMVYGVKSYPSLDDVPDQVDVVEVFRPGQIGIVSDEAGQIAEEAGLTFISDTCMGAMHAILDLGPGPYATD